jgi:hypothetical protein
VTERQGIVGVFGLVVISVDNQMYPVGNVYRAELFDVFVDETTIRVWSKNPLYVFKCDSDGRKRAWARYAPADAWRARSSAISTADPTHRVP